ncbi:hypothetical protein AAKU55_000538 [Oxalobacteraceae bacterium GrIS 1.11]
MMNAILQGLALAPASLVWLRGAASDARMLALARRRRTAYYADVPDKEGNRFDSLNRKKRTNRAMRFFYVHMPSCAFYERRWWGSLRACWFFFFRQSVNPAICRSPRLTAGHGTTEKKDIRMPNCTSTPGQFPVDLINRLAGQTKTIDAQSLAVGILLYADQARAKNGYGLTSNGRDFFDDMHDELEQKPLVLKGASNV